MSENILQLFLLASQSSFLSATIRLKVCLTLSTFFPWAFFASKALSLLQIVVVDIEASAIASQLRAA
jgi:hypothetical protein